MTEQNKPKDFRLRLNQVEIDLIVKALQEQKDKTYMVETLTKRLKYIGQYRRWY